MSVFISNHGLLNGIHSIPKDLRADIMECVQNVKHSGTEDGIKAADRLEQYILLYNETEIEQDATAEIVDHLTAVEEKTLEDEHMKDYQGTKADWEYDHMTWLQNLTSKDLKKILNK